MSDHQSPFQHQEDQVKPDTNPHQQEPLRLTQILPIANNLNSAIE
ncbi:hypothetical protein [Nostoc sp. CHAB 5715]|nr:hypothetical protein [Nostoc sp. CHAB 5715]